MTTRYEPWSLLNQLQRELMDGGRAAPAEGSVATAEWTPAVDIKERADGYVLFADVPGVRPEDIDVSMENGILTLHGTRVTDAGTAREGYKRVERVQGTFYRRFSLPDTADAEGISARYQNGVLEIVIPKRTANKPRKIVISS